MARHRLIEECFQQAKGQAGLDQYQVRSWRAWYAHITLSMLALSWLAASNAQAVKGIGTSDPGLIGTGDGEVMHM
jgi:SRSO17 transposase